MDQAVSPRASQNCLDPQERCSPEGLSWERLPESSSTEVDASSGWLLVGGEEQMIQEGDLVDAGSHAEAGAGFSGVLCVEPSIVTIADQSSCTTDDAPPQPEGHGGDSRYSEPVIRAANSSASDGSMSSRSKKNTEMNSPLGKDASSSSADAARAADQVSLSPTARSGASPSSMAPLIGMDETKMEMLLTKIRAANDEEGMALLKEAAGPKPDSSSMSTEAQISSARRAEIVKIEQPYAMDCAARWNKLLCEGQPPEYFKADGHAPEEELAALPEAEARVIRADVQRTRADDPVFQEPRTRRRMEWLLARFCRTENVCYTQGLHEIAAVFLYLQHFAGEGVMHDAVMFACFAAFVRKFAPYFFDGEEFVTLHIAFLFFKRLLLYHHPDLHNCLEDAEVSPVSYAAPWFITVFSSRTPLFLVVRLWDLYIVRQDTTFAFFFATALIAQYKARVFAHGSVAQVVALEVAIDSEAVVDNVWKEAVELHQVTPRSFPLRLGRALTALQTRHSSPCKGDIENKGAWSLRVLGKVEKERCFLLLASEIVTICTESSDQIGLLLLDVRPRAEFDSGHLPQAIHFHPESSIRRLMSQERARAGRSTKFEKLQAALQPAVGELQGKLKLALSELSGSQVPSQQNSPSTSNPNSSPNTPRGEKRWADDDVLAELFAELRDSLGERWLCDRSAHLCLLSGQPETDGGPTVGVVLGEAFTELLSLPRVSVALGGANNVHEEAVKRGVSLERSTGVDRTLGMSPGEQEAASEHASIFGSAWSALSAAASPMVTTAAPKVPEHNVSSPSLSVASGSLSNRTSPQLAPAQAPQLGELFFSSLASAKDVAAAATGAAAVAANRAADGLTAVRQHLAKESEGPDRPANWPRDADLSSLPKMTWRELSQASRECWRCEAWVVEPPPLGANGKAEEIEKGDRGCLAMLCIQRDCQVVCAEAPVSGDDASDSKLRIFGTYPAGVFRRAASRKTVKGLVGLYFEGMVAEDKPALTVRFDSLDTAKACANALRAARAIANPSYSDADQSPAQSPVPELVPLPAHARPLGELLGPPISPPLTTTSPAVAATSPAPLPKAPISQGASSLFGTRLAQDLFGGDEQERSATQAGYPSPPKDKSQEVFSNFPEPAAAKNMSPPAKTDGNKGHWAAAAAAKQATPKSSPEPKSVGIDFDPETQAFLKELDELATMK